MYIHTCVDFSHLYLVYKVIIRITTYLLVGADVRDGEVEPQAMPIVVRVRTYLDVVLALAQLDHLSDVTAGWR